MTLYERYIHLEAEYHDLHQAHNKSQRAVHDLRGCLSFLSSLDKSPRTQGLISKSEYEYLNRVLSESKDADTLIVK